MDQWRRRFQTLNTTTLPGAVQARSPALRLITSLVGVIVLVACTSQEGPSALNTAPKGLIVPSGRQRSRPWRNDSTTLAAMHSHSGGFHAVLPDALQLHPRGLGSTHQEA